MTLPTEPRKSSKLWLVVIIGLVGVVFAGVASVYFGGKFIGTAITTQKERRARLAALDAEGRQLRDATRESMESGTVDGVTDRLSKFSESVGSAAESAGGADRQGLRVAQRLLQSMTPALSAYESASKELQAAGFVKPETMDSREAIASRVVVVKKFGEANDGLARMLDGMESRARVELEKEGVPTRMRDQFLAGYLKSANLDLNRTIRNCDTELVGTMLRMLSVLDREWGSWKAADGVVNFDREPVIEEYGALITKLEEISERQATAQEELIERTSQSNTSR